MKEKILSICSDKRLQHSAKTIYSVLSLLNDGEPVRMCQAELAALSATTERNIRTQLQTLILAGYIMKSGKSTYKII